MPLYESPRTTRCWPILTIYARYNVYKSSYHNFSEGFIWFLPSILPSLIFLIFWIFYMPILIFMHFMNLSRNSFKIIVPTRKLFLSLSRNWDMTTKETILFWISLDLEGCKTFALRIYLFYLVSLRENALFQLFFWGISESLISHFLEKF